MLQIHFHPRTNIAYLVFIRPDGSIASSTQIDKILHDALLAETKIKRLVIKYPYQS